MGAYGLGSNVSEYQTALLVHPGTQYSFHLARELSRHNILSAFYTSLAINGDSKFARWMAPFAKAFGREKEWQNRVLYGVPADKIHRYPAIGISAQWRIRRGQSALRVFRECNDRFQKRIPDRALREAHAVIGFDTSSHILAARTNALGRRFILDRSSAYPRHVNGIFEALRERFPEWSHTWETKPDPDIEIEDREHQLAKLIVVPSRFVAQTLSASGVPRNKIRINPFGTDLKLFNVVSESPGLRPLVFLFVGALTAGKGLPLLLEAWQRLKPQKAELWIVGPGKLPETVSRRLSDSVRLVGPVARQKLPARFQKANVFVCPSFFEGLAQVQVEAAACGLPIIGTTASGAQEVVEEGRTGFVIEPGNLDQLVERMNRFIERPSLAGEMRENARRKRLLLSWSAYGDRWQEILREVF